MNDTHYGYVINTHYDWINMINTMKNKKPKRFKEFQYSEETLYHYLDQLQHNQHIYD